MRAIPKLQPKNMPPVNKLASKMSVWLKQGNKSIYLRLFSFKKSEKEALSSSSFIWSQPSITDGVHRNENFAEIIPFFSTFSNFFKKRKKKLQKPFYVTFQCGC